MYDAVALGELLIDFTSNGTSERKSPLFEANPGGAPCNVLSMLAKLGCKTAFIGKVGDDVFGRMLKKAIEDAGISSAGLIFDKTVNTTLAIVHNEPGGERDFSFFRNPGADTMLSESEVSDDIVRGCRIFHFGSLSLTDRPASLATEKAVFTAKNNGALISFDPNLRRALWKHIEFGKSRMLWGLSQADTVKVTDEELTFLMDDTDIVRGALKLLSRFENVKLLLVTKGKHGSEAFCGGAHSSADAFITDKTVDTTGAGDCFLGCALSYVLDNGTQLAQERLDEMLRFSNAAASISTTRFGAMKSMPERGEITRLLTGEALC